MYNNKTKAKALLSDADVSAHLEALVELLEEKKAIELASLDLRQRSTVADYFVVGGANSRPHGQALVGTVHQYAKEKDLHVYSLEGQGDGTWILIDLGFLVVHIMQEEERRFYNLEELWSHAEASH